MMKRGPSRSLAEKRALPQVLPPLSRKSNIQHQKFSKDASTSRPPTFVIRKKNSSFMDTLTTRKPAQPQENQQNIRRVSQPIPISVLKPTPSIEKLQPAALEALGEKDSNKHEVTSISRIHLDESYIFHEESFLKKPENLVISSNAFDGISTGKSLKKTTKRRKIEQCKIRKINWGSKNNVAFDLTLSAIRKTEEDTLQAPIESLQQLYAQMI